MKAILLTAALLSTATLAYASGINSMDMHHSHGAEAKTVATADTTQATHKAVGVVKKVDTANGKVTLAHEPINTLNWPAMTMAFVLKDRALLSKLSEGQNVQVEFQQQGKDYVITSAR